MGNASLFVALSKAKGPVETDYEMPRCARHDMRRDHLKALDAMTCFALAASSVIPEAQRARLQCLLGRVAEWRQMIMA